MKLSLSSARFGKNHTTSLGSGHIDWHESGPSLRTLPLNATVVTFSGPAERPIGRFPILVRVKCVVFILRIIINIDMANINLTTFYLFNICLV